MKVFEILEEHCEECYEEVMVDENDEILSEGAIRQWRRTGKTLVRKYRCMSGKKKGKLVASPGKCGERKDPKKVRTGRKTMRSKKGIIQRKSKVAKRGQISKMVTRLNARLMGKTAKTNKVVPHKTMS